MEKLKLVDAEEVPRREEVCCPLCNGRSVKSGRRHNRGYSVQRYRCKVCGTSFQLSGGYFRDRFPLSVRTHAMALYTSGLSLEKVQMRLKEELDADVSRSSIYHWLKKTGIKRRRKSCGEHKNQKDRELIEISLPVAVRFASSKAPGKIFVLAVEDEGRSL